MDEDRIGLVLAKTSELRSKIMNCIHRACTVDKEGFKQSEFKESEKSPDAENEEYDDEDVEEGEESLLNIKDALESLEAQLSSLQALQQQQWYEKEAALAEIEHSQMKLLKELKEYKGKDFEVIHEAIAFASETEDKNDLLLPPYPSRPSQSSVSNNNYLSTRKFSQNGLQNKDPNSFENSDSEQKSWGPFKRLRMFVGTVIKMSFTVVGVIAILSLAGFEPSVRKRDNEFKRLELFENNVKECPPGKVNVIEDGEMRCVVKERVEIPFDLVADTPDVSYGCG